jgi:hypothetical protein
MLITHKFPPQHAILLPDLQQQQQPNPLILPQQRHLCNPIPNRASQYCLAAYELSSKLGKAMMRLT